mgnify:CR=1 FL=1
MCVAGFICRADAFSGRPILIPTEVENLLSKIETVFLLTAASTSYISSSIVRDVLRNGGDVTKLVPKSVIASK